VYALHQRNVALAFWQARLWLIGKVLTADRADLLKEHMSDSALKRCQAQAETFDDEGKEICH